MLYNTVLKHKLRLKIVPPFPNNILMELIRYCKVNEKY